MAKLGLEDSRIYTVLRIDHASESSVRGTEDSILSYRVATRVDDVRSQWYGLDQHRIQTSTACGRRQAISDRRR
jgi:hypothetical protein